MVVGVGVDLVEVPRIRRALEHPKIGARFRDRVYTPGEIHYCEGKRRGRYESYAGRFAAKEAVMKALGVGWGSKVSWKDIEVLPVPGGKPEARLRNKACVLAQGLGVRRLAVSITHTEQYAIAYAIAQEE